MAEDTEKRFQSIMNKLFLSPKSNLSRIETSGQKTRGQKRTYSPIESNFRGDSGQGLVNAAEAPPCRPWDRNDLMRRLATFKSMKWFAKPKAVGAVNCARRGWVNVDFDIIACEVCGARLQFSTPSTWNQQQVEKAALVFSLKLDTGHKLLCPWIDNPCSESLGLFPPKPAPVLVDQYKERSSALVQLSALPLISVSAIESMTNPLLEHFLKQSIAVEFGTGPNSSSWTEYLRGVVEAVSGDLYYQAHRLLSLCGWEPRLLPYVVDCADQPKLSGGDTNLPDASLGTCEQNKLCVYVSGSDENTKDNEDSRAVDDYYDPSSTVLDCKLCGASIGLWAFATVPRPLEMVRVVGCSVIGSAGDYRNESSASNNDISTGRSEISPLNKVPTSSRQPVLNLTIAGGPPPTKQNFRAVISLPVIGRNLRARFSHFLSEVLNTGEEGHISQTITTEGLSADVHNEKTTGPKDIACTPTTNNVEHEPPSAIQTDETNDEQLNVDTAAPSKELSIVPSSEQRDNGVGLVMKASLLKDFNAVGKDKDLSSQSTDRKMYFDPIRQHRHFCPWVASTDSVAPGWRQTLLALQKEKTFLLPDNETSPSSPSFIKVDDPITSIRKLFESPPAKKSKPALT